MFETSASYSSLCCGPTWLEKLVTPHTDSRQPELNARLRTNIPRGPRPSPLGEIGTNHLLVKSIFVEGAITFLYLSLETKLGRPIF